MTQASNTNTPATAPADDIRPVVRTAGAGNAGLWIFVAVLLVGGFLLFQALQAGRAENSQPVTTAGSGAGARVTALPPLALPQAYYAQPTPVQLAPASMMAAAPAPVTAFPERYVTRIVEQPASGPFRPADVPEVIQPPAPPRPSIVYDTTIGARPAAASLAAPGEAGAENERVLAGRLENPSFTVPKGTVIPAVLESALDSTRPGAIRALVSRDVMGFDGTRLLIPRGSRLYGEYDADLNYGQNRALVRWTRLLRPDGVTIDLDSPAADPLGRAGLRGKVNSHFWARFGGAILQSVLDIGVGAATRTISNDAVVVALPGSVQNVTRTITENQSQVRPTLTVKQGVSVSVFVAKDLDFSSVDR